MLKNMDFQYYEGTEGEQFECYEFPKILFSDERYKNISHISKMLYGLMLSEMRFSNERNWIDENGKFYIHFSNETIENTLGFNSKKAENLIDELERNFLIECDRHYENVKIYVKKLIL